MFASDQGFADLYVEKVLEANPLVRQPPAVIRGPATDSEDGTTAIRVYHRRVPARLPPGPALLIGPDRSCDLWDIGEPIAAPIVGKQEAGSPLLAFVKLENAQIAEARGLSPKGPAQVLVSLATGEAICVAFDRPEGKVLVLSAALDDPADLPLRTAFPILVGNALSWFDGRRDELHESVATGTMIDLPAVRRDLSLWSPAGSSQRLPDGAGALAAGPLDRRGVWRVAARPDGPAEVEIACNLAIPRESDLRPPAGLQASAAGSITGVRAVPAWYALDPPGIGLVCARVVLLPAALDSLARRPPGNRGWAMLGPWRWGLDLTDPAWLWGLAALPLLAWWSRRGLVNQGAAQKKVSLASRAVIVALLVLILAGLTLRRPILEPFVVFAVDGSLSIGEEAAAAARDYLEAALAAARRADRRFCTSPRPPGPSVRTGGPRLKKRR